MTEWAEFELAANGDTILPKKWRYNRAKKVAPVKNLSLDPWVPIPRYSCPQNMERSTHLNIFLVTEIRPD